MSRKETSWPSDCDFSAISWQQLFSHLNPIGKSYRFVVPFLLQFLVREENYKPKKKTHNFKAISYRKVTTFDVRPFYCSCT